jgi:osmoprotectant transport system permease protein
VELIRESLEYIQENPDRFWSAFKVHVQLSGYALLVAIGLFIPIGVLASRSRRTGAGVIGLVSAARVVPSISVLFLLYPYRQEIGEFLPFWSSSFALAFLALVLLAGPPLVINADAGFRAVPADVIESARGMGMTEWQVLRRVQWPIALPVVIAGIRIAAIEVVASATLASFLGVPSLGRFVTSGLSLLDNSLLLVGAIPIALLALAVELALTGVERAVALPS